MDWKTASLISHIAATFMTLFCVSVLAFTDTIPSASILCAVMLELSAIYSAIIASIAERKDK